MANESTIATIGAACVTGSPMRVTVSRKSNTYYHRLRISCGAKVFVSPAFAASINITVPYEWNSLFTYVASLTANAALYTYSDTACKVTVGSPDVRSFVLRATESSILTHSESVILGEDFELSVTKRYADFYHKIRISIGDSYLISPGFSEQSSLSVPLKWSAAMKGASGEVSVRLYTYTDSSCKVLIGSSPTASFTVLAPTDGISCVSGVTLGRGVDGVCNVTVSSNTLAVYHKAQLTCGGYTSPWSDTFLTNGRVHVSCECLNEFTESTDMTATLTVRSFTNSDCLLQLFDDMTREVNVKADESVVPSLTVSVTPFNTNPTVNSWGIYLKGYTKAAVSVSASAFYSAEITKCSFSAFGYEREITAASETYEWTTPVIQQSGELTVFVSVTDSRGRTKSESVKINAENYSSPRILSASACRCLQDMTDSESGTYMKISASKSFVSLDGKNSASITRCYKSGSGDFSTAETLCEDTETLINAGLSCTQSYTVRFTVTDSLLNSDYRDVVLPTETVCFNALDGGRGAAFGKYAESENLLELSWGLKTGNGAQITASGGLQKELLWQSATGAGTGDTLSVPDIERYTFTAVQFMDSQASGAYACVIPCIKHGSALRGTGGVPTENSIVLLGVSLIINGSEIAVEQSGAYDTAGAYAERKICAIYGLL